MIRLVINWAPLSGDRAQRQQNAWNAIESLMATNEDFVATTVVCPGDPVEDAPRLHGILTKKVGNRNLPFVGDIMDHARSMAEDDDWIGFLNSDVIPTQRFIDRIRSSDKKFVMCNVTDIDEYGAGVRYRPPRGGSIDGVFTKSSTWGDIRVSVPDLVLGSRAWDTAFVLWSFRHLDSSEWFLQSECLHILHGYEHWASENDEACRLNTAALNPHGGLAAAASLFRRNRAKKIGKPHRRIGPKKTRLKKRR